MQGADSHTELIAQLRLELRSRNVPIGEAAIPQLPTFDWSIQRDGLGFIVSFPSDYFRAIADWIQDVFGAPKFEHEHGPTRIHRDDNACVTVMMTTSDGVGQLILTYWKDPAVASRIAEKVAVAIEETINSAAQDACGAVQQAIDSLGSPEEEARWNAATAKLDDVHDALNRLVSSQNVRHADRR
jgi:hypothetical protein